MTRTLYCQQRGWPERKGLWRLLSKSYGGVREGGLGREGIKFAIEDMTEVRMMVIRTPGA